MVFGSGIASSPSPLTFTDVCISLEVERLRLRAADLALGTLQEILTCLASRLFGTGVAHGTANALVDFFSSTTPNGDGLDAVDSPIFSFARELSQRAVRDVSAAGGFLKLPDDDLIRRVLVHFLSPAGNGSEDLLDALLGKHPSLLSFLSDADRARSFPTVCAALLDAISEALVGALSQSLTLSLTSAAAVVRRVCAVPAAAASDVSPSRRALTSPTLPSALELLAQSPIALDFDCLERHLNSLRGGREGTLHIIVDCSRIYSQSHKVYLPSASSTLALTQSIRSPASSLKRPREEEKEECGVVSDARSRPSTGLPFTNVLFLPADTVLHQQFGTGSRSGRYHPEILRSVGLAAKPQTLASRHGHVKRLQNLLTLPFCQKRDGEDLLSISQSRFSCNRRLLSSAASCAQGNSLPFASVPIVIGNSSDWLGEKASATANHKWCVYVRGINNAPLGDLIDHVTFVLHPSFPKPQQTVFKEPFALTEHGWGEFDVALYIKFKHIELPVVVQTSSSNAAGANSSHASPTTATQPAPGANRSVYVKVVHALKFSHRNPLLLAAESRVNQDVAAAMTQPPAVLFGTSGSGVPSPTIAPGTSLQSVQFLLTNPTLTMALTPLPDTPAAVMHKLHCVPPNGNAYYGVPNYTPFALVDHTVVSEARDELSVFHPSTAFLEAVRAYLRACATYDAVAQQEKPSQHASLPPHLFAKIMKYSPLLCNHSSLPTFNEWDLYRQQAAQDRRLLTAVEADFGTLMRNYVSPLARDEVRGSILQQLKAVGTQ